MNALLEGGHTETMQQKAMQQKAMRRNATPDLLLKYPNTTIITYM
jgi:hypothetical protein